MRLTPKQRGGLVVGLFISTPAILWTARNSNEEESSSPETPVALEAQSVGARPARAQRRGVEAGIPPQVESTPGAVLLTPSPQRSTTPALEDLPEKLRARPFLLTDGTFSMLWASQQGEAANKACWAPLDALPSAPPPLVEFRVKLDDSGRVTSAVPTISQLLGATVLGSRPQDRALKKLVDCLHPFVMVINVPRDSAQSGVVTTVRPHRPRRLEP